MYSDNIEFIRQSLLRRVTSPQMGLALYPQNSEGTYLRVQTTSSVISIQYQADTITTENITYTGMSVEDLSAEINRIAIPVKASPLSRDILSAGSFISTGGFVDIPNGFTIYDRTSGSNGVVLRLNKITIRHKALSHFKLLTPYLEPATLPWYPRISTGQFSQVFKNKIYHFSVPEYNKQVWSLKYGKPFVDMYNSQVINLGNNVVQLPRFPVFWNGENLAVFNGDIIVSQDIIEDIDTVNGLIYFKKDFYINLDTVRVSYTYLENSYVYRDININGHFTQNPQILDKYVILYALPVASSYSTPKKRAIYHIISDDIVSGIDSIQLESTETPLVILGAYNIRQLSVSDKVQIIDTRVKGGGLVEKTGPVSPVHLLENIIDPDPSIPSVEDSYRESTSFWDIGRYDGKIYPGAAAVVFDIPLEVKAWLSLQDINNKSTKFLSAGIYPILDFSFRPLPSITGISSQISAFLPLANPLVSGEGWISSSYTLPNKTIINSWIDDSFDIVIPITDIDNTQILRLDSGSGYYQTYLKGNPDAGIEWKERETSVVSGEDIKYGRWETKRLKDIRDVDYSGLIKGYISFDTEYSSKDIKDVVINSPFRNDFTGQLKSMLSGSITQIHSGYTTRFISTPQQSDSNADSPADNDVPDNVIVPLYPFGYVTTDINNNQVSKVGDYFGVHHSLNYLFQGMGTVFESGFNPHMTGVAEDLVSFVSGNTVYYRSDILPWLQLDDSYTPYNYKDVVYNLARYTKWKKDNAISSYSGTLQVLTGLINNLRCGDGYISSTYRGGIIHPDTHVSLKLPELLGYELSETYSGYNEDYRMLEMLPAVMTSLVSLNDISEVNSSGYTTEVYRYMGTSVLNQLSRMGDAITGVPTLSGFTVSDHWYITYNRYSHYLNNTVGNAIEAYKILKPVITPLYAFDAFFIKITNGNDPLMLDMLFGCIKSGLDIGYERLSNTVLRNGILPPEFPELISHYGWLANNYSGHMSLYGRPIVQEDLLRYKSFYEKGLMTLLKAATTPEGFLHETTYINNEPGPFEKRVPYYLPAAFAEGLTMDPNKYIPYVQSIYNTIEHFYNANGVYWQDSVKVTPNGGREEFIISAYLKLYNRL